MARIAYDLKTAAAFRGERARFAATGWRDGARRSNGIWLPGPG